MVKEDRVTDLDVGSRTFVDFGRCGPQPGESRHTVFFFFTRESVTWVGNCTCVLNVEASTGLSWNWSYETGPTEVML